MSPATGPDLLALFPGQNPSPVLRMDREGTLLYANPGAAFLLEEWGCLVGDTGPECLRQAVAAALEQGAARDVEIKSGSRDISFVVAPLAELGCANLYGHDVTDRKQAEEALRRLNDELAQRVAEQTAQIGRERQRLQGVLDMLPVYAVLLTPDYHVPVANRFFRERFGESEGRRCYEYLFDRTEPCEVCETLTVLKTSAPHRWQWTGPDGRNYDVHDFPFRDADGASLILKVGLDVTERRRAEAELEKHRDHLMELVAERTAQLATAHAEALSEKNRLQAVMETLPVGVALVDADGGTIQVNAEFEQIWGGPRPPTRSVTDYSAYKAWWADTGRPVQPEEWASARALRDGEAVVGQEVELQRFDGTRAFVLNSAAPIRDGRGQIVGSAVAIMDITERKRAEEVIRQSELRYRALFDQMTEGFALHEIICDEQGAPFDYRFLDINPAFERLTGLKRDQVVGKTLRQVLPVEDPMWVRTYGAVALGGEAVQFEHYSQEIGRHYSVLAYCPAAGQFAVIFQDITTRRNAEDALRQSEERLRALAEALPQIVWTADAEGAVEWYNQRWYQYTGEPEGFGAGWAWERVSHPDDVARTVERWQVALKSGGPFENEIRVRRRDGEFRWFLVRAWPMRDAAGKMVRWFGTNTDVHELKIAEEALRQSRLDLARAQEVAQIGSWRLDVRQNVLTWSEENYRIFGVAEGTPLTYETFLGIVHPEDRESVDKQWQAGLRGEPYDIEHRILADGRVKWVREKAYLEFDDTGALLGGFGITQDITERKLIEAERELQARLKDEFLALLGHELRNPLAAISAAVRLLSNGVTAKRRASLDEMIGRQVTVLQRLVDDLLDLARITHGQIELKEERVDLAELLQRVTAAARSSVAGRGQELTLRMPSERVLFLADGVRLEQVVTNLLSNASKYTGHGGRIELSGAREGSDVVIRCRDNGRGIPLGMQRMIFEPFARVQSAGHGAEAGIGIGLALVKRLVEMHAGTVTVQSGGEGAGSEFTVRIPLVTPPPVSREGAARAATRSARGRSVVIVDDNADVAQALAIGLEQAGHKVRLFGDAASALSGLTRLKPDAILLDIGLPGMDGYELAARLRQRQNLKRALYVGISGFKRRAQSEKDGFDQYFVKPVDLDRLLACIETAKGQAREPGKRSSVKPLRALLVEDNEDLAKVTAEMLLRDGLDVRIAFSGREALETAAGFRPHLTICDLRLPDMPGQEVIRNLRLRPATRQTYTVVLTATHKSDLAVMRRRAKSMGVDQFLAKPLTSGVLSELIRKVNKRCR